MQHISDNYLIILAFTRQPSQLSSQYYWTLIDLASEHGGSHTLISRLGMLSRHRVKWHLISLFIVRGLAALALVNAAEEEYREELTLRPLSDGKVSAHFSFSTLLHGAVPRSPSTLGTDDACTPACTFLLV